VKGPVSGGVASGYVKGFVVVFLKCVRKSAQRPFVMSRLVGLTRDRDSLNAKTYRLAFPHRISANKQQAGKIPASLETKPVATENPTGDSATCLSRRLLASELPRNDIEDEAVVISKRD